MLSTAMLSFNIFSGSRRVRIVVEYFRTHSATTESSIDVRIRGLTRARIRKGVPFPREHHRQPLRSGSVSTSNLGNVEKSTSTAVDRLSKYRISFFPFCQSFDNLGCLLSNA